MKPHTKYLIEFQQRVHAGEPRLALLQEFARLEVRNRMPPRERRKEFQRMHTWRKWLERRCWCCCDADAVHRHHIITIEHGGRNCRENIVSLCERCHEKVHPWMEGDVDQLPYELCAPMWAPPKEKVLVTAAGVVLRKSHRSR